MPTSSSALLAGRANRDERSSLRSKATVAAAGAAPVARRRSGIASPLGGAAGVSPSAAGVSPRTVGTPKTTSLSSPLSAESPKKKPSSAGTPRKDISDPGDRSSKQAPPPKTTPRATELSPRVALSPRCTNTLPTTSNISNGNVQMMDGDVSGPADASLATDISVVTDVSTDSSACQDSPGEYASVEKVLGADKDEAKEESNTTPTRDRLLSSSMVSDPEEEKGAELWSPKVDDGAKLNKRRSDIISKNGDIISKHRLSSGGADLDHAPKEAHYYAHTDTEHIASQLDALQEEQIAALHAQLRQEKIARGVAEEREAASAKEKKDLESQIRKLEDNLERARDTTTGRKAAQKLRKLLGEQDRAIELLCQYVDAHDVMAALTEAGLSQGETTPAAAVAAAARQSLDIMCTLCEEDEEELEDVSTPARNAGNSMAGRNLMMLINLRKELGRVKDESEELRQTADCCFVREQESKRRCEELEAENKELQTFTEQMESTHSRLMQGVIELQTKQAAMVTQEVHEEALAEIEQLKADQLSMVPNLNALLEEIETLKAAASDGSTQKELLQKQCEEMKAERDAHAAACSELMVKFEEQQREITDLRAAAGEHELLPLALAELDRKCEELQAERDAQAAACCELERKVEQMQGVIDAWQEVSAEKVGSAQATAVCQQEELERHVEEAEAARQECQRHVAEVEAARQECGELREQLVRQAGVSEDSEHFKAELAIANTRIEELEVRLLARKEEERKRTSLVFDEILKSNEDSYSQQFEFLNQRIEALSEERDALTKERDDLETDRDETIRAYEELEVDLSTTKSEKFRALGKEVVWRRGSALAAVLLLFFVASSLNNPLRQLRDRRLPLLV